MYINSCAEETFPAKWNIRILSEPRPKCPRNSQLELFFVLAENCVWLYLPVLLIKLNNFHCGHLIFGRSTLFDPPKIRNKQEI